MATIIDTLCVELGLDTSKFTEGQRQAERSLQTLQTGAERTGERFGDVGVNILAFLKLLEARAGPFAATLRPSQRRRRPHKSTSPPSARKPAAPAPRARPG